MESRLDYFEYLAAGHPAAEWGDYAAKHEFPMEQFVVSTFRACPSLKQLCLRVQAGSSFVDTLKRLP